MADPSTTTNLILIFCAILLSYRIGTAIYMWSRRNHLAPVAGFAGGTLDGEAVIIRQLDTPARYDFDGYELRQVLVQTRCRERPVLFEVSLEENWGQPEVAEDGCTGGKAEWLVWQPASCMLLAPNNLLLVCATYLLSMPSPPSNACSLPVPSIDEAGDLDTLELATTAYNIDPGASSDLHDLGTPLFRPETRTEWVRTGRRREQGIFVF